LIQLRAAKFNKENNLQKFMYPGQLAGSLASEVLIGYKPKEKEGSKATELAVCAQQHQLESLHFFQALSP
jgi:hypothetical protein